MNNCPTTMALSGSTKAQQLYHNSPPAPKVGFFVRKGRSMATAAQTAALEKGRPIGAPLGGLAVKDKIPPSYCPRCRRSMAGRSWHSYLGHLGLHGLADRHFGGDIEAAQRRLRENGLARQDPYPENGAWPEYEPI